MLHDGVHAAISRVAERSNVRQNGRRGDICHYCRRFKDLAVLRFVSRTLRYIATMELPSDEEKTDIAKTFLSDEAATEVEEYDCYFKYYNTLLSKKPEDHVLNIATPAYSTHRFVVLFFGTLIRHTWQTKEEFSDRFAADVGTEARDYAVRALLQVSLMIDCASKIYPEDYQMGDFVPQTWKEEQPFARFVESCFPSRSFQDPEVRKASRSALKQRGRLKAWKLGRKQFNVRLRPTDNLAEHLVFDSERRILHVFRQVGFLKAHLYRSRDEDVDISLGNSLAK